MKPTVINLGKSADRLQNVYDLKFESEKDLNAIRQVLDSLSLQFDYSVLQGHLFVTEEAYDTLSEYFS